MTVTIRHLVGAREPLDIVIAAQINDNWNNTKTDSVTPIVEALSYIPSMSIEEDFQTSPNIIKVSMVSVERITEDEPLGDDSHYYRTDVLIDCWAESPTLLQLFEDEINRILWEVRPNKATRLNKSDGVEATLAVGTSASEVESFQDTEVKWEFLGTDDESAHRVSSQSTLQCNWFKLKT